MATLRINENMVPEQTVHYALSMQGGEENGDCISPRFTVSWTARAWMEKPTVPLFLQEKKPSFKEVNGLGSKGGAGKWRLVRVPLISWVSTMNPWLFNWKQKGEKDEINNKISSSKTQDRMGYPEKHGQISQYD